MKVSTATSVLVHYTLESAIDKVISIGFDGVEIWCGRPHLFRRDYSEDFVFALGEKIRKSGLDIVSAMPAFYRYPFSLSNPIESVCHESVSYMTDCIDNAALVGAGYVLVVPMSCLFNQTAAEARKLFVKNLALVCDYAERKRVKLGLEVLCPGSCNFMPKTKDAVDIINELGSDCLGIVLDTGEMNLSKDSFESAFDIAGERIINIHVNDNNGIDETNSIPGEYNFDFYALRDTLQRNHYNGYLSLELGYHYSSNPVEALSKAIAVTRDIFGIKKRIHQPIRVN